MAKIPSKLIGFRLKMADARKLEQRAEKEGCSAGEFARTLVLAALDPSTTAMPPEARGAGNSELALIASGLQEIKSLLRGQNPNQRGVELAAVAEVLSHLRGDIATAAAAILAHAGRVNEKDAEAWVRANLFNQEGLP